MVHGISDGYLVGEHYTCPHCGESTEVWSRITGYYRPVQNWNEGKSQEFKERKVYDIGHSILKGRDVAMMKAETKEESIPVVKADKLYLFTTKTCPNCPTAKKFLNDAGIEYEVIDANDNPEMARRFSVMQAPTLVCAGDKTFAKHAGVPNIIKWTNENK